MSITYIFRVRSVLYYYHFCARLFLQLFDSLAAFANDKTNFGAGQHDFLLRNINHIPLLL